MKTYGSIVLKNGSDPAIWEIACDPHVMIRIKRLFERINKGELGTVRLTATPENSRELLWFLNRYPMQLAASTLKELRIRAAEHRRRERTITKILTGNYKTHNHKLALPLRPYQNVAVDMTLKTGSLLCADDVGLGKTAIGIGVIADPESRPALVVTLTHLPTQWKRECEKFCPSLNVHIIKKGTPYDLTKTRHKQPAPFPDVIIINYHKLNGWAETLAPLIKSVIFDETQELRCGRSLKCGAAQFLSERVKRRLGLTATPIYNYGCEIYNVISTLAPEALGTSAEFHREWCDERWGDNRASIKNPRAFGTYLRDQGLMIRRTRVEVGRELPPLQKVPHYIDADLAAIDKISDSAAELARIIIKQGAGFEKMRASEELDWRLRQATGIAKAPYVADFVRIILETEKRIVLYGWHHEVYALWKHKLDDFHPAFYTGEESPVEKDRAKQSFVSGESRILIMSLRAGAGLDGLQGTCRTAVFGELDWSPGVHEQCIGRIHRDGQDEPCVAYFLIADHGSDPVIADVLGVKRQQIEGIRDPSIQEPLEAQASAGRVRRLAEEFLKQRGILPPVENSPPADEIREANPVPCEKG